MSDPAGGKLALVLGAGCSAERPPGLPLAWQYAQTAHDRLVDDHILELGDCDDPTDLSKLADVVYAKCGGQQRELVKRMNPGRMEMARAGRGYENAAALLREGAVVAVLTLNYDLAMTHALKHLGAEDTIGIVTGPEDHANQKAVNVFYLHRSADCDPETWVLRTAQLDDDWKAGWEQIVATNVLSRPLLLFVGLGSPAGVLQETCQLIDEALPDKERVYQADICDHASSRFAELLSVPAERFIQLGWAEVTTLLGRRLVREHVREMSEQAQSRAGADLGQDIDAAADHLRELDLPTLGIVRAHWLGAADQSYLPRSERDLEHLAELLIGLTLLMREGCSILQLTGDGVIHGRLADGTTVSVAPYSARGLTGWVDVQALFQADNRDHWKSPLVTRRLVLVSGAQAAPQALPADIMGPPDDTDEGSIIGRNDAPVFVNLDSARENPIELAEALGA